jgi:hypothetical protein
MKQGKRMMKAANLANHSIKNVVSNINTSKKDDGKNLGKPTPILADDSDDSDDSDSECELVIIQAEGTARLAGQQLMEAFTLKKEGHSVEAFVKFSEVRELLEQALGKNHHDTIEVTHHIEGLTDVMKGQPRPPPTIQIDQQIPNLKGFLKQLNSAGENVDGRVTLVHGLLNQILKNENFQIEDANIEDFKVVIKQLVIITTPTTETANQHAYDEGDSKPCSAHINDHCGTSSKQRALDQNTRICNIRTLFLNNKVVSRFSKIFMYLDESTISTRTTFQNDLIDLGLQVYRNLLAAKNIAHNSSPPAIAEERGQHEQLITILNEFGELSLLFSYWTESKENLQNSARYCLIRDIWRYLIEGQDPVDLAMGASATVKHQTSTSQQQSSNTQSSLLTNMSNEKNKLASHQSNASGQRSGLSPNVFVFSNGKQERISLDVAVDNQKAVNNKRKVITLGTAETNIQKYPTAFTLASQHALKALCSSFIETGLDKLIQCFKIGNPDYETGNDTVVFFRILDFFLVFYRTSKRLTEPKISGNITGSMDPYMMTLIRKACGGNKKNNKIPTSLAVDLFKEVVYNLLTMKEREVAAITMKEREVAVNRLFCTGDKGYALPPLAALFKRATTEKLSRQTLNNLVELECGLFELSKLIKSANDNTTNDVIDADDSDDDDKPKKRRKKTAV